MKLQKIVGDRIINDVIRATHMGKEPEWRVLVVDELTMKMVSASLQMYELAKEKIMMVESIEMFRTTYSDTEAVYFLTPTQASVEILLTDFKTSTPKYKAAHVYFTQPIPDSLFRLMADSRAVLNFKSLKEVNMCFVPKESLFYSLNIPECTSLYYNEGDEAKKRAFMEKLAEQIASVCASLDEYPAIRYREDCEVNGDLAQLTQVKLDALKSLEPNLGEASPNSQLIILDRGFDPTSPLLHELTLQAMTADLIDIKDNIFSYKASADKEKKIVLDEGNELWTKVRHKHVAKVIEIITAMQKELKNYEDKIKDSDLKGMQVDIKKLPKHEQDKAQITALFELVGQCMDSNNNSLCEVEQEFATGTDQEGCKIRNPMASMVRTLMDPNISISNKIRVILIYIIANDGIKQDDLTKMIQAGKIPPEDAQSITNLANLGVNVVLEPGQEPTWKLTRRQRPSIYTTSRWNPILKDILEQVMDGRLDTTHFPFLRLGHSLGTNKTGANSARQHQYGRVGGSRKKSRVMVVVVGGVTYSETRTVYEVMEERQDWEVVLGGSHILTPSGFLKDLSNMGGKTEYWRENETDPFIK